MKPADNPLFLSIEKPADKSLFIPVNGGETGISTVSILPCSTCLSIGVSCLSQLTVRQMPTEQAMNG